MNDDGPVRDGARSRQRPEVQALVEMFAAAVLMSAVALLAIAIGGRLPPRLALTGPTWQWTGTAAPATGGQAIVPDAAGYTVDFASDGTFVATADCNRVSGTYRVTTAGRAAGATNRLALERIPADLSPCGVASMSDVFLRQLGAARGYGIVGSVLTITLDVGGAMTFEPATSASRATADP